MYIGLLQMALTVQGYIFFQNHPPALRSWGGGKQENRQQNIKYFHRLFYFLPKMLFPQFVNIITQKIYPTSGENFIFKRRMWWFLKNLYTTEKNYIKVVVKTPAAKASAVADEVWTMQKTNGWKYYQVSIILVLGTFPKIFFQGKLLKCQFPKWQLPHEGKNAFFPWRKY